MGKQPQTPQRRWARLCSNKILLTMTGAGPDSVHRCTQMMSELVYVCHTKQKMFVSSHNLKNVYLPQLPSFWWESGFFPFKNFYLFIWLYQVLVLACGIFLLQKTGSSSLTRSTAQVPCIGYAKSQPLDKQGCPI